jgi:uncharacterized membrane protein
MFKVSVNTVLFALRSLLAHVLYYLHCILLSIQIYIIIDKAAENS